MKRICAIFAVLLAMVAGGGTARALSFDPSPSPVFTSFSFTGLCLDCTNPYGVLTLKNYSLGQTLSSTNFVSFSYRSSVFPSGWTITDPVSLSGSIATVPGPNDVYIADETHSLATSTSRFPFIAAGLGSWSVDGDGFFAAPLDYGEANVWAAVPEPRSWAMMVLGFGLAGVALRRRARPRVSFG